MNALTDAPTRKAASTVSSEVSCEVSSKVGWRLLPFLMLCYFVAYLDRVNVGFAALTMNRDLGLSPAVYGFGAGVFFLGYFLFEVPSNLVLERVGARRWIARIMISWALVSASTAFVIGEWSFYLVRFGLGLAEAGFFPGIVLYLTYWFPSGRRAGIVGTFMMAVPISAAIGSPLSAWIMAATDKATGKRFNVVRMSDGHLMAVVPFDAMTQPPGVPPKDLM